MRFLVGLALFSSICVLPVMGEELVQIKGKVLLDKKSDIPKRAAINPAVDKNVCLKDKDFNTEEWVVDEKTRGIRDVVVYIVSEPTKEQAAEIEKSKARAKVELAFDPKLIPDKLKAVPKDPVVFDQPCCRYIPHVAVARVGQSVVVKNSAPIAHNVSWTSDKNGAFNPILAPGKEKAVGALVAERNPILIGCTIHAWMKAYLLVVDTPYHAVTNDKGEFTIKDLPKGKYRVVYWHPEGGFVGGGLGRFGSTLEIKGGDVPDAEYSIKKPEPEKK